MNLYIYADESGVLDQKHNEWFVYGGLIFINEYDLQIAERKYVSIEKRIRYKNGYKRDSELKAFRLSPKDRTNIYRSLNKCLKFGAVIDQKRVHERIFANKKSKQRYLDYVLKIAIRRGLEKLIRQGIIIPDKVKRISFYVDEHTTATDGIYELKEALEQELCFGTFNYTYQKYYEPLFNNVKIVELKYCNSATTTLVRAADIVANKIYYKAKNGDPRNLRNDYTSIILLP